MKRSLFVFLLLATLPAACSPLSRELMRQADERLTYSLVQKNPTAYEGRMIVWGGVIIETTNRPGETLIQVRETELDHEKRPKNTDRSAGRFLVRASGFLDPAIYAPGRKITVGGELAGTKLLPLGEMQYAYPLILAKEIHLWPKGEDLRPYDPWYWGYPHWWRRYPWGYPPYWW